MSDDGAENTSRSAEAISPLANELNPSPNLTTATRPAVISKAPFYPPATLAIRFLHTTYLPGGVVEPRRKTAPLSSRFGRVEQEWNQMGPH